MQMAGTPVNEPSGRDDDPAQDSGEPDPSSRDAAGSGATDPSDLRDASGEGWRELPPSREDWLTEEQWLEWLASVEPEELPEEEDPENGPDPEDPVRPGTARSRSRSAKGTSAGKRARAGKGARAVKGTRRGPGQPGSARRLPGESPGPVGAFATGQLLDTAAGGPVVFGQAEHAAGDDARFAAATEDELTGIICGLDRTEAAACALKHAAVAELIRRSPEDGYALQGPAQMPATWHEFTEVELADALAETRAAADGMLQLARDLETRLPGTKAAFRSGVLRLSKVEIIARATAHLDPAEARAAEALVLDRAGRLTPGGLASAIKRAAIEVAPDKAAERREKERRNARVQRWMEDSGNAALMGRELPPADVLAADQRITWWATRLKKAGLDGDMDQLRALAYMDIMLGRDSRPAAPAGPAGPAGPDAGQDPKSPEPTGPDAGQGQDPKDPEPAGDGPGGDGPDSGPGGDGPDSMDGGSDGDGPHGRGDGGSGPPAPAGPGLPTAGVLPAGFAGRLHLTIPLATLLNLAERPGEMAGLGPIDPALARDLAHAAATNPATSYCVTVTDQQGHAIGHGCARLAPKNHARTAGHDPPGPHDPPGDHDPPRGYGRPTGHGRPGGHGPPGGSGAGLRPGFTFTASGDDGPPGGYGAWRLSTGLPGRPDLLIAFDPIAIDTCDHRFEGRGHDPGVKLRHLAQIRHATCTGPTCRRPAQQCDFEHNVPYDAGGRTCLCNGGPTCRHEHRLKQHPKWKVEQITPGTFRRTAPSGRQYTTEPTRYPI